MQSAMISHSSHSCDGVKALNEARSTHVQVLGIFTDSLLLFASGKKVKKP